MGGYKDILSLLILILTMGVQVATSIGIAVSGATLLLCIGATYSIYSDVSDMWNEMDNEIGLFKVTAFLFPRYAQF